MSPEALRAEWARLERAGEGLARRGPASVEASLGRLLDLLCDRASPWRRRLETQLPAATGFSPETVRAGLALALEGWSGDALRHQVARELGGAGARGFSRCAVLLAGAIPMPTLLAVLAPLLLRTPALVKCAARDPATAPLLHDALQELDPELAECLAVVRFRGADEGSTRALLEAECVVALGSDETLAAVRSAMAPGSRLVGHGHRVSLALVGPEAAADLPGLAAALALDVALWDQLGCLSPLAVYVEGEPVCDALAEALDRELEALERRMPRGSVDAQEAALIAHQRADAELRAAAGRRVRLLGDPDGAWTVVREDGCELRPCPLHRFVRVHPLEPGAGARRAAWAPLRGHLAGVALAGYGARADEIAAELARLGVARVCAPGRLQAPPLGWHHDGQPWLAPLARFPEPAPTG